MSESASVHAPPNPRSPFELKRVHLLTIDCNLDLLPAHMQEPVADYVLFGAPIGDFLTHVLANEFIAVLLADDVNAALLVQWGRFVHNDVPDAAQGSRQRVLAWQARGGLLEWRPSRE